MLDDYDNARQAGKRRVREAMASGQYPYLTSLEDLVPGALQGGVRNLGLVEIPIKKIVGTMTKGRQNSFASNFMPLLGASTEFAEKWSTLYDSQMEEGIREPILAYEYMWRFYVQEGNKRVSVSAYAGVKDILANVIRIMPFGRPRDEEEAAELRRYQEFVDFYEVCPLYSIEFSHEGGYAKLAEACGQDLEHGWSEEAIKNLKSAYGMFERIFTEHGGDQLDMTAADAMLIYLAIYPIETLANESKAYLDSQVDRIWSEITLAGGQGDVALVETADAEETERGSRKIFSFLQRGDAYTQKRPLSVAFLYEKSKEESSWSYAHELGRLALESEFEGAVKTMAFDDCGDEQKASDAIDRAVEAGCQMVFTTSLAMMPITQRAAIFYPEVRFLNCSVNLVSSEVMTYYTRSYDAKFIMGALAAMTSDNHKIGYRANFPIFGAVADINAFAIGAAMVDPRVKIYLDWSGSRNSSWEELLEREDIRVISGLEMIRPRQASREYGLYCRDENGMVHNLCAPLNNWGKFYERLLRPIVRGTASLKDRQENRSLNFYWGMATGAVELIFSKHIPFYSRKTAERLVDAIMSGYINPFDGEIHSQEGMIKGPKAPRFSSREIISMDWLNDNVIGSIPSLEELTDEARELVAVSGIDTVTEKEDAR